MKIQLSNRNQSALFLLAPGITSIWLVYAGIKEGLNSDLIAIICASAVVIFFIAVWRNVCVSVSRENDVIHIERNGRSTSIRSQEVRRLHLVTFPPSFSLALIIFRSGSILPIFAWAGFMSSNIGNYRETVAQIEEVLSRTPRAT